MIRLFALLLIAGDVSTWCVNVELVLSVRQTAHRLGAFVDAYNTLALFSDTTLPFVFDLTPE